jgi:hypothetical protein
VDVVIVRDGKNFKGRMLGAFLGIVGKGQLEKVFAKTLKAIEALIATQSLNLTPVNFSLSFQSCSANLESMAQGRTPVSSSFPS